MSHFFRALEQAEQDRAARREASAEIPSLEGPGDDGARVDPHLVSLLHPTAPAADQYRVLRHVVETRRRTGGLAVVGVTSAGAGDGKTLTAINLAGALAQAHEHRVLLVDADLRAPAVARALAMTGDAGLADALRDPARTLGAVVQSRPPFRLSVLTAGRATSTPYELLKSARLEALLSEARASYDYVVVDTPPVVPFPDFRLVSRGLDGSFLVVAAHRTRRALVEAALDVLDPAALLGLVFNRDDGALALYRGAARHAA